MSDSKNKDQMEYLEIRDTENIQDAKYIRAKERLQEVKRFYAKLMRSTVVIAFLAAVNYYTNEWSYMWFLWAAFGIGIGIAFRAIKVFGGNPFFDRNWEERKIKEFMEEETGETYQMEDNFVAIFNALSPTQRQNINGKITLFEKFSSQQ